MGNRIECRKMKQIGKQKEEKIGSRKNRKMENIKQNR